MEKLRGIYEKVPGSKVWWIRWTDENHNKRREKAGSRSMAINLLAKRKAEALQKAKFPAPEKKNSVSLSTLMDDALEHSAAENGERSTHELRLKIEKLRAEWGSKKADEVTKQDIVRWLTTQKSEKGWTVATMNRWQAAFSLIFRVGIDNEKVASNPASRIRRKAENNQRLRFLSAEEEARLVKVLSTRHPNYLPVFMVSLHTGLRASEQWRLQWSDIDFERKILTVRKQKHGHGERHIPLNSVVLEALKKLATGSVTKGPIFLNSDNRPMKAHRDWFDPAVEEAGIEDYTWHGNRHTFASRLAMADVNIRTIAQLMGHRTIQMSMRYSHLSPDHNLSAVEKLVAPSSGEQHQRRKTRDTAADTVKIKGTRRTVNA